MATKAKLYQDKFDLIDIKIDERSPQIIDGLIAHFPLDGEFDNILDYESVLASQTGNHYSYIKVKTEAYVIPAGCALKYEMYGYDLSDAGGQGVEVNCTDATTFRGKALDDDGAVWATCIAHNGKWYDRSFSTFGDLLSGKTTLYWSLFDENDTVGTNNVYFRNIRLVDVDGHVIHVIWGNEDTVQNTNAYSNGRVGDITVTNRIVAEAGLTKTANGLAVESATTNVVPDGDFTGGLQAPYTTVTGSGTITIEYSTQLGKNVLKHINPVSGESVTSPYTTASGQLDTAASGDIWTGSIYVKTETPDTTINLFVFGLNAAYTWIELSNQTLLIQPEDGWVKHSVTLTMVEALTTGVSTRLDLDTIGTVYWSDWQLEEKPFATEFVNGSRGVGYCRIEPNMQQSLEGTVALKVTFDGTTTISQYPYILNIGLYSWNPITIDSIMIYRGRGWADSNTINFIMADNSSQERKILGISGINAIYDHDFYVGVSWSVSLSLYRFWVYDLTDKTFLLNTTASWPNFDGFEPFATAYFGGTNTSSPNDSKFKDFSIYNRYLTDAEVVKLVSSSLKITNLKMIMPELKEWGYKELTPLNYTQWVIGTTGMQGDFSRNGDDAENYIIEDLDPWRKYVPIWEARPTAVSGPDGGWNYDTFNIDGSEMYRFSVWINRTVLGNGSYYHGCHGYTSAMVNNIYIRSSGATTTNPYFQNGAWGYTVGEWFLFVGHIWPIGSGTGANYIDSGIYNIEGKTSSYCNDFVFMTDATYSNERTYLYYSTDTSTRQQFVYPRVDVLDGTEPSIEALLTGHDSLAFDKAIEFSGGPATNPLKLKSEKVEFIVKINEI